MTRYDWPVSLVAEAAPRWPRSSRARPAAIAGVRRPYGKWPDPSQRKSDGCRGRKKECENRGVRKAMPLEYSVDGRTRVCFLIGPADSDDRDRHGEGKRRTPKQPNGECFTGHRTHKREG